MNDKWVTDLRGNGIHESDWGWLIDEHLKRLPLGNSRFAREESVNGRSALFYTLSSNYPEKSMSVSKEEIWIDPKTYFPIKFIHYDQTGKIIRRSVYKNIQLNIGLKKKIFDDF